jgi:hypothetical protein
VCEGDGVLVHTRRVWWIFLTRVTDLFPLVAEYLHRPQMLSKAASVQLLMQDTRSAY